MANLIMREDSTVADFVNSLLEVSG